MFASALSACEQPAALAARAGELHAELKCEVNACDSLPELQLGLMFAEGVSGVRKCANGACRPQPPSACSSHTSSSGGGGGGRRAGDSPTLAART